MQLHVVDAFTDRPFTGNPAGVCLLPAGDWPEDAWLSLVAAEVNHPETAFALPLADDPEADWEIRWFTPLVEANLCGHATLATAHVLRTVRGLRGTARFRSRRHGVLLAHTEEDGSITLDFPSSPALDVPVPEGLLAALTPERARESLGATKPQAVLRADPLGDLLVVLPDEAAVRSLAPDLDAVAALTRREGLRGLIATARTADPGQGYDFVSRFFAPASGIPEDPVTGSAHTVLAPYWSALIGRNRLTGLQASPRSGLVRTAVHGDRVHLTGDAVTVLEGTLHG
ncbi:PhzF family phenazine biosynthesis protein [Streptomyces sp. NPDC048442]|uniref:PhzF family phenazine biosynthesis protein n=1 Tax=Streptomyces sp. NPDC048442 TaxID=3154823 RepID=UPI00343AD1E3